MARQLFVVEDHRQLTWLQDRTHLRDELADSILGLYDFSLASAVRAQDSHQVVLPERYLPPRAIDHIDTLAYQFSDDWYLLNGDDPSRLDGISLGQVMKIYAFFLFKDWMSEIEMLCNCIEDLKPEQVTFLSQRRLFSELAGKFAHLSSFRFARPGAPARRFVQAAYYGLGLPYLTAYLRLIRRKRAIGRHQNDAFLRTIGRHQNDAFLRTIGRHQNDAFVRTIGRHQNDAFLRTIGRHQNDAFVTTIGREGSGAPNAAQVALVYEKSSKALEPVHSLLAQGGLGPVQAVAAYDPKLRQRLANRQVAARTLTNELDASAPKALERARSLARTWRRIAPTLSLTYRGLRFDRRDRRLESLWKHDGFRWLSYQDAVTRYYQWTASLRTVVMLQDVWPLSKLFALIGRRYPARTLVVQHGVTLDKPYYQIAYLPLSSDGIAVWGEESGRFFAAHGVDPAAITVTGSPLFDRLAHLPTDLDRAAACRTYHLNPSRRIVLYASQNFPEEKKRRVFLSILRSVLELDDVELVVKLHPAPRDQAAFYEEIMAQEGLAPASVHILKKADLYTLLRISDVLVTVHSTVHVEAALLDRDILIVNLDGDAPLPIVNYEAALTALSAEEVAEALRRILFDPATRQRLADKRRIFVEKYALANDGQSARRVVNLIADLAR